MAKYIDVDVSLKKIIRVDSDNLHQALKIAEEEFYKSETPKKLLDDIKVTFKENKIIGVQTKTIAKLFQNKDEFNKDLLLEFLDLLHFPDDIKEIIYEETLDILKKDYHFDDLDIKI